MKLQLILNITLILLFTKLLGLLMRKIKVPEVVGALLAGIVLGPTLLGWVDNSETLEIFAEVGVLLIMFTAGIETNLKEIKAAGKASLVITILGIIVPLALGYLAASCFYGFGKENLITNMYYGVMLTATSVTITVATLKELGKLKTRVGTSILSAAILDDIIGLVILSIFIGMENPDAVSPLMTILNVFLFFLFAIGSGILFHIFYKLLERKYPKNRRMVIFCLVLCFFFSYAAEKWFNLADITGAFFAGIVLANKKTSHYIKHRVDISSYMIFAPIFFASVGITTNLHGGFDWSIFAFGIIFVVLGLIGKVVGCGVGAKLCGFSNSESIMVGVGMMARAEVILITAQKGLDAGLLDASFMPYVILMIVLSSLLTPILLKLTYKSEKVPPTLENFDPRYV